VALYREMTGDDGMTNSAVILDIYTPLSVSLVSNMSCICQFGKYLCLVYVSLVSNYVLYMSVW
jgi:hypothetical protein